MSAVLSFRDGLIIGALSWLLAGAVLAQDDTITDVPPDHGSQATVEVDDMAEDSAIAARLRRIFESLGWYSGLEVTWDNGIVTLVGLADSVEHREWADRMLTFQYPSIAAKLFNEDQDQSQDGTDN